LPRYLIVALPQRNFTPLEHNIVVSKFSELAKLPGKCKNEIYQMKQYKKWNKLRNSQENYYKYARQYPSTFACPTSNVPAPAIAPTTYLSLLYLPRPALDVSPFSAGVALTSITIHLNPRV
jgi:hypothetical protein